MNLKEKPYRLSSFYLPLLYLEADIEEKLYIAGPNTLIRPFSMGELSWVRTEVIKQNRDPREKSINPIEVYTLNKFLEEHKHLLEK